MYRYFLRGKTGQMYLITSIFCNNDKYVVTLPC